MTSAYSLPRLGSPENPFASIAHAQQYGFTYVGHYDDQLDYVRLSVNRGGLHFVVGFARRTVRGA